MSELCKIFISYFSEAIKYVDTKKEIRITNVSENNFQITFESDYSSELSVYCIQRNGKSYLKIRGNDNFVEEKPSQDKIILLNKVVSLLGENYREEPLYIHCYTNCYMPENKNDFVIITGTVRDETFIILNSHLLNKEEYDKAILMSKLFEKQKNENKIVLQSIFNASGIEFLDKFSGAESGDDFLNYFEIEYRERKFFYTMSPLGFTISEWKEISLEEGYPLIDKEYFFGKALSIYGEEYAISHIRNAGFFSILNIPIEKQNEVIKSLLISEGLKAEECLNNELSLDKHYGTIVNGDKIFKFNKSDLYLLLIDDEASLLNKNDLVQRIIE